MFRCANSALGMVISERSNFRILTDRSIPAEGIGFRGVGFRENVVHEELDIDDRFGREIRIGLDGHRAGDPGVVVRRVDVYQGGGAIGGHEVLLGFR